MIVQQYRKRARSTKESRHRLTKPGRSRLLAVKIRMYDNMDAAVSRGDIRGRRPEKRTTRPCAEQGRIHSLQVTIKTNLLAELKHQARN